MRLQLTRHFQIDEAMESKLYVIHEDTNKLLKEFNEDPCNTAIRDHGYKYNRIQEA